MQASAQWGALLSPQGKIQAEGLSDWHDDAFWLDVDGSVADPFIKRMKMYRLRAAVEIADLRETHAVGWDGGAALTRVIGTKADAAQWKAADSSYDAARIAHGVAELQKLAHGALYWAKVSGRDMVQRYSTQVQALSAEERASQLTRAQALSAMRVLARAVDARDPYTRQHSDRVADLAVQLATVLRWPVERIVALREAALVHDVGKIGVPEAVLCKPGRLTDEEFGWIKKHPEIGHRILKDIPQLADILPGVLHHHERIDGRGYPHGLAGEAIPLMARIIAVADTFDALSSTRSYRAARPRDVVLAEIARSAGSQLDPAIAAAMAVMDLAEFDRMLAEHATTAPAVSVAA